MKKVSILAILTIAVIMLVGCDFDNRVADTTPVEFGISVGSALQARALVATNPATAKAKAVYVSFKSKASAADDAYVQGNSASVAGTTFAYGGAEYETGLMGTPTKSGDTISCSQTGTKYLSQGQWTIKAIAVDTKDTADVADDEVLYFGETTVFVNKNNDSAALVLVPVEDAGTGTVSFGNGVNLIQTHASTDIKENLRLSYDIDGATGTIACSSVSYPTASYTLQTDSTITQGAHLVKVVEEIYDGAVWKKTTGGYVIPVFVVKDEITYITGNFNPAEWISSAVSATIELGADVKGTLNTTNPKAPVFTLTGNATSVTYQWYVDGVAEGGTSTTGAITTTAPGRHNVQIVAKSPKGMYSCGYILMIDGEGTATVL